MYAPPRKVSNQLAFAAKFALRGCGCSDNLGALVRHPRYVQASGVTRRVYAKKIRDTETLGNSRRTGTVGEFGDNLTRFAASRVRIPCYDIRRTFRVLLTLDGLMTKQAGQLK